jgi:glycosyltransferase involved in cell wall biosynthesis
LRIGINTRNLLSEKLEGFGQYTLEITKRICENHPEHEFFLFFDRPFEEKYVFAKNVTPVVVYPPTRHPILYVIWFEFSLKKALEKHEIDLFWSPDGFCNLKTNIPQIITIHDINFEHNPKDLPFLVSKYFRYFFPKFARKAKKIITVSTFSKQDIFSTYKLDENKVTVVYNGANEQYQPINSVQQKEIRDEYTNGFPFFLFVGSLHPRKNVQRLIDAFEIISSKNSQIRLVIVGSSMWKENNLKIAQNILNKVIFTGHLETGKLTKLMASAKVLTYVPYFEGFGIPLVEAMKCGTPILAANATCLPEVAENAAIYCNPFDVKDIANGMYRMLSEPLLCNELSKLGLEQSKKYHWDNAADLVWKEIEQLISSNKKQ